MSADESGALNKRVTDLEVEIRELRARVAALEGLEITAVAPTPLAPTPIQTVPLAVHTAVPPRAVARMGPPPIPASASAPHPAPVATAMPPLAAAVPPPVAARVGPPMPPPPAEPARPSALHDLLDALGLLPPAGTRAGEAGIGAWWATRIGALILVIGVVFLGVYISLTTPPWVKLLELAAIAGGVTAFGAWIERRMEQLGAVILGAGLALCYFTAFAGYAVPAVKVIESITVGAVVQAVAVVAIGGAALWRRSPTVGTMAVLLGFVSAFFSMAEGFDDFAVVAGLGLSAMAVFFRHREGWPVPACVSAVLVHGLNAVVAVEVWSTQTGRPGAWYAFAIIGAAWAVHFVSVVIEAGRTGAVATAQRWIQSFNTSLAVMAGFATALQVLSRDSLSWYFFGSGLVLVGAAAWAWRVVQKDGLFGMFAVKAASLIALGVIVEWDARTRWIALVVQAAVLMAAAVRTRRVSLAITSVLAWLVSLLFFGEDIGHLRGALVSGDGIAVVLYLLAGGALLAWVANWLRARAPDQGSVGGAAWVLGLGGAVPVAMAIGVAWEEPWVIVACVAVSIALIAIARAFRSLVPVLGAVAAMLAAHVLVQTFDEVRWGLFWLWGGAGLIALRSAALAWLVGRREDGSREAWQIASEALLVLALAALGGAMIQSMPLYPALTLAVGFAVGCVATGVHLDREDLNVAGLLGLPVAWGLQAWHGASSLDGTGGTGWLWLAAAGVPAALAIARLPDGDHRARIVARALAVVVGVLLAWTAARMNFGRIGMAWSILGAASVYLVLGRGRGCVASSIASSVLLVMGAGYLLIDSAWARADGAWSLLLAAFALLTALAFVPLVLARQDAWLGSALERPWRIAHAVVALLGLFVLATIGHAVWQVYGSVVWAFGGVLFFVLGLAFRARSHRVAGLIALGLCIPRVFLYDIQSTKYRIAAFVVLGVLLLIVGFSYQKFRYLIEGDEVEKPGGGANGGPDLKGPRA